MNKTQRMAEIEEEILAIYRRGGKRMQKTEIMSIGELLWEAKVLFASGDFTIWQQRDLPFSQVTASRYMQIAGGRKVKKEMTYAQAMARFDELGLQLPDNPDREDIQRLAKEAGIPQDHLLQMSQPADPHFCGSPEQLRKGKWFAENWYRLGCDKRKWHLRDIHYALAGEARFAHLGKGKTVNGETYENTIENLLDLEEASRYARMNDLVPVEYFDDKRNNPPNFRYLDRDEKKAYLSLKHEWEHEDTDIEIPDLEYPNYKYETHAPQRYHLVIWAEKTNVEHVLEPVAKAFGAITHYPGGQFTTTSATEALERWSKIGKPVRVGWLHDLDPGGENMAVAIYTKLQKYNKKLGYHLDIKMFDVLLTVEQVQKYHLATTPLKEKIVERGGDEWMQKRGIDGGVELNALNIMDDGATLIALVRSFLDRYYDHELEQQLRDFDKEKERELEEITDAIYEEHREQIDEIEASRQLYKDTYTAIYNEMAENIPELDEDELPEAEEVEEADDALFDSMRSYREQLNVTKAFQRK